MNQILTETPPRGSVAAGGSEMLSAVNWRQANQTLAAKILSEFMYEEIICPEAVPGETGPGLDAASAHLTRQAFRLSIAGEALYYSYEALPREFFGFYRVLPETIRRVTRAGAPVGEIQGEADIDVEVLLTDLHALLGMKPNILAPAFRELSNTLVADCHMLADPQRLSAREWLNADEPRIEGELSAHPWIVANKSRLGFSMADYRRYAPESHRTLRLHWLALDRERGEFHSADLTGAGYELLIRELLDDSELAEFYERIREQGADPERFYLLPVHPWQWENRIVYLFARDLATGRLIYLGEGRDEFLPQQSIRTLSNVSRPGRPFVKLPISILNTSVYRGLPVARAAAAPTLTTWLHELVREDDFLRDQTRIVLLGEFASLHCRHSFYGHLKDVPYQYNEMLGVIYRESLRSRLDPNERALPLAALFQRDREGRAILTELIEASGLAAADWIARLLTAILPPLLHFLYKYGFVFSPHGQNALIALDREHKPTRLVIKDFVDDANLSVDELPEHARLPEQLYDLLDALEPQVLIQWIQSGLFVCVFRYLTEILVDDALMTEREFWTQVEGTIRAYQDRFPEMADRFAHFNLHAPAFPKLCLNSTRLLDLGYEDSAERPVASVVSLLDNPLYIIRQTIQEQHT